MKLIKCALISLPLLLSAHYVTASQVYNIDEVNKMSVNDYEKHSRIFLKIQRAYCRECL